MTCRSPPLLVYVVVFIGSLAVLAVLFGAKWLLQQRMVRRFVRSMHQRLAAAEQRGAAATEEEVKVTRPAKSPRVSAIELQQVRQLLRSADKAISQNKLDDTEKFLIQALTIQPRSVDVGAQLAKLYLTTERESKAEAMYRELLQQRDDVSFHANLGLAYYRQSKYVEACYAYQEALNRDPKNPDRCAALGRACIAARRFEEAAPLLEKASAHLSRNTELLHLLAECYLQLNWVDRAEEAYRKINKLEPYDEDVKAKLKSITGRMMQV